ncbi:MAG: hypothetical protein Q9190_003819 [Brigantiaea leucoxantha]
MLRRSVITASRIAARSSSKSIRTFSTSIIHTSDKKDLSPSEPTRPPKKMVSIPDRPDAKYVPFEEVESPDDLFGPGAAPGTIPTDVEQATGLERLEILGKMQGIDIFDMKPLDSSRVGTLEDPIIVRTVGDEQHCGCTGCPADSHRVKWLTTTRKRPMERCPECGSVYLLEYIGPPDDPEHPELVVVLTQAGYKQTTTKSRKQWPIT